MRLKEDNSNWKARGIVRRDFRHTHGDPEVDTSKAKGKKSRSKKNRHKHVWVEVDYKEYERYATGRHPYWIYDYLVEPEYWRSYTTYFVCADCLDTKRKVDEGKRRAHYRRKYGRSW